MNDVAAVMPAHANAMGSLGDSTATRRERSVAAFVCLALVICAALAIGFGLGQGPELKPLLPITATMWSLADLLTSILLLGQFYVNGRISLAILSTCYGLGGLLTWPFLFTFPGVFSAPPLTLGEQSQFAYLWLIWHGAFPVLVIASQHPRFALRRIAARSTIVAVTVVTALLPLVAAAAITATIFATREALPHLVIGGHLQPLDRLVFHPVIVGLNIVACFLLLARRKRMTTLQLWLCVAMFAAGIDSLIVNLSAKLYSYAWDTGKFMNVLTAGTVLVMILIEIVRLYGEQLRHNEKLERDLVARNRVEAALRASEERFRQVEEHAPIGLALIDLHGRFLRVNPALCRLTGYDE
ncbi:MAG: MASE4 domain-containing protein, partial [Candidatus Eremiobacteraeota bacterium]|nr:MASE4 domain-containing protein [Candidatus Eremiobacteraeota bacterium]